MFMLRNPLYSYSPRSNGSVIGDAQQNWNRVKEIFTEVCEAEDRPAALARLTGGDALLLAAVGRLLALHDTPNLTLDAPAQTLGRHAPGDLLAGRYRVTRFLASGGMGDVYAGVDEETGEQVALKFIGALGLGNPEVEARFHREVALAGKIEHPNVCRVFGLAFHHAGGAAAPLCVMELLEGETLAEKLERDGSLPPVDVLAIARQLCNGLAAAHAAGIVHRDLKPGNIFLAPGRAVIIDFGLAAAIPNASLSAASAVIGTLAYMSPEQLEGEPATERSDLFSLGVVLYEMLTGRKPHPAKSPFRLAAQKQRENFAPPSATAPRLPAVWEEVVTRCLRARPEHRFASVAELQRVLERGRPSWRFRLLRTRVLVPAALVLASLLAWFAFTQFRQGHQPTPEAAALYIEGRDAMTQSAPFRGALLLQQAVAKDPQFLQAYALLAAAYAETDQIAQAREAVLHATAAADRRWLLAPAERASLDAARATVVRDFPAAAEPYRRLAAATSGPERVQALLALGRTLSQAGQNAPALAAFEQALQADPQNAAARVRLASLLARRRDYDRAAAEFAAAESRFRSHANLEGLSDLLLARATFFGSRTPEATARDIQELVNLSQKTGNHYHQLSAQFLLANRAALERHYDRALAITRQAAAEAQKEGLPVLAARAQSEIGYLFLFQKQPQLAEPLLREALEMAVRSQSPAAIASVQMRLGEVLADLQKREEAAAIMRPALAWYRQGGYDDVLPLILIKWATALPSNQIQEKQAALDEALALATSTGEEMYQAMALQRLASETSVRNLAKALQYSDRALPLARKTSNHNVVFATGRDAMAAGQFERGERLLDEFERAVAAYPEGSAKQAFQDNLFATRAAGEFYQGNCPAALRHSEKATQPDPVAQALRRRIEACLGQNVPQNLAWARTVRATDARIYNAAAYIALRARDLPSAALLARQAIELTKPASLTLFELEGTLLLRAATRDPGLSQRALDLSSQVGFHPPQTFASRRDLLDLWNALP